MTSQWTNWAASTTMTAAATHRPGWRTGMALIGATGSVPPEPDPAPPGATASVVATEAA